MQNRTDDIAKLVELTEDLRSTGLYWAPALLILTAAQPDLLSQTGDPSPELQYIDVERGSIDFAGMLRDLHYSEPVREMVKVGWALWNGGGFDEDARAGEQPPRFDDIACRLDSENLAAVLDAMRVRKGLYWIKPGPRAEALAAHNEAVHRAHQRLLGHLEVDGGRSGIEERRPRATSRSQTADQQRP